MFVFVVVMMSVLILIFVLVFIFLVLIFVFFLEDLAQREGTFVLALVVRCHLGGCAGDERRGDFDLFEVFQAGNRARSSADLVVDLVAWMWPIDCADFASVLRR